MSNARKLERLFDLPLGARFKYAYGGAFTKSCVFVFLSHEDCGLVADYIPPERYGERRQGVYSASESREKFEKLRVIVVE